MSDPQNPDFPDLHPVAAGPRITSIFDFSAEALGELMTYIAQNPPPIPITQVVGFPQQSRFLERSTSTVDVVSTTTETTLYSKQIAGGDMGSDRFLRLTIVGDYLHNNVTTDSLTLRIKFGGTTWYANAGALGTVIGAARHPWGLVIHVANAGSTSSQMIFGSFHGEKANEVAPTTGIGAWGDGSQILLPAIGISTLATVDTSTAQTLEVTAKWSVSSANNSWRKRYAMLELV